jgi:hypothetical protein
VIVIGDDWAEEHHDLYLIDESGQRLSARRGRVDNVANGIGGVAQMAVFGSGGFDFSNAGGFLINFVSAGPNHGRLLSISIEGLPAVLTNASLAGAAATQMSRDPTDGVRTSPLCCRLKKRGGAVG